MRIEEYHRGDVFFADLGSTKALLLLRMILTISQPLSLVHRNSFWAKERASWTTDLFFTILSIEHHCSRPYQQCLAL